MPIPFEVLWVPGEKAMSTFQELKRRKGVTPVILGGREAFERVEEKYDMDEGADLHAMLEKVASVDAPAWFQRRHDENPEYYEVELGDWQGAQPNTEIRSHEDVLTRKPFPEVALALVPTDQSWQVPCYLRAGGWNEVPDAIELAAIFRYWEEKYGAAVASMADDVIEMTVSRPPTTPEGALALAHEQFLFAPDLVHQGTEELQVLASALCGGTVWWFWWD
jgi:hypothetical protein